LIRTPTWILGSRLKFAYLSHCCFGLSFASLLTFFFFLLALLIPPPPPKPPAYRQVVDVGVDAVGIDAPLLLLLMGENPVTDQHETANILVAIGSLIFLGINLVFGCLNTNPYNSSSFNFFPFRRDKTVDVRYNSARTYDDGGKRMIWRRPFDFVDSKKDGCSDMRLFVSFLLCFRQGTAVVVVQNFELEATRSRTKNEA
jgi:hypothetical protein